MRNHTACWFNILSCTVLALLLCSVALLVVPQLYYLYYRSILPGLPAQWVPPGNLSGNTLWRYLLLPAGDNTTHHAKGVTVWIATDTNSCFLISSETCLAHLGALRLKAPRVLGIQSLAQPVMNSNANLPFAVVRYFHLDHCRWYERCRSSAICRTKICSKTY